MLVLKCARGGWGTICFSKYINFIAQWLKIRVFNAAYNTIPNSLIPRPLPAFHDIEKLGLVHKGSGSVPITALKSYRNLATVWNLIWRCWSRFPSVVLLPTVYLFPAVLRQDRSGIFWTACFCIEWRGTSIRRGRADGSLRGWRDRERTAR